MTPPSPRTPKFKDLNIGPRIKSMRKAKNLSLADLAGQTDMSEATLSRVENEQTPISAHNLYALSKALQVDVTLFFENTAHPVGTGVRSVTRKETGVTLETSRYLSAVLCTDLSNKRMHPAINTVSVRSLDEAGGYNRHTGEEFLYVMDGTLMLHTQYYSPLRLEAGDAIYFDGAMNHAYINDGKEPAKILVLTSTEPAPG